MQINTISLFTPKKNNYIKQKAHSCPAIKNQALKSDVFTKSKKQPVSFKGAYISPSNEVKVKKLQISKELKEFATYFEAKLKTQMKPSRDIKNFLNPAFIKKIEEKFQENEITGVLETKNVSLNNAVNYLVEKEQIKLPHYGDGKIACFLDESSLKWLKKYKNTVDLNNIVFYIAGNDKESGETELRKIFDNKNIQVSTIELEKNNEDYKYPNAKTIANTIQTFVERKFPHNKSMQDELREILCDYLDDYTIAFSYQTLAEKMREQYKIIEKEVLKQGKTMDDVSYVIPFSNKSYDLINYMFAIENDLDPELFINKHQAWDEIRNNTQENKIYVLIDDFSGSGASFIKAIFETKKPLNMIFSPIVGTRTGRSKIQKEQREKSDSKFLYLPVVNYNELGYSIRLKYFQNNSYNELKAEKSTDNIGNSHKLTGCDIDFLMDYMLGGHGNIFSSVFFPYMLPDNSSEIATLLAGGFLDNDNRHANKGRSGCYLPNEDYKKLKEIIEQN